MKGYKALDQDMRAVKGNGMQYEVDKWYSIEGKVIPYMDGFHFCKFIEELNWCYPIKNSRIFEVEACGEIRKCNQIYAAEKIKLVRELTKEEINDYFKQNQKRFIEGGAWYVRGAVAGQGYGLEILIRDKNWQVRKEVAGQGYGLDILINDEDEDVRATVAGQEYGLDTLIHDVAWQVRKAAAEQGYGLDILINDVNSDVRQAAEVMAEKNNATAIQ